MSACACEIDYLSVGIDCACCVQNRRASTNSCDPHRAAHIAELNSANCMYCQRRVLGNLCKQIPAVTGSSGLRSIDADKAAGLIHRNLIEKLACFRLAVSFSSSAEMQLPNILTCPGDPDEARWLGGDGERGNLRERKDQGFDPGPGILRHIGRTGEGVFSWGQSIRPVRTLVRKWSLLKKKIWRGLMVVVVR